jgi:haloalkane dehalogenase
MYRFFLAVVAIAVTWLYTNATHAQEPPPDPREGVFSAEFPFESRYVEVEGHKLHYIDKGQGQTFVFLHGNPTSSYLWRNVMPYVEPQGRVVAVDNIGFGKSDKPELDYTYQTHYRFIEAFIGALNLEDIILVVHDWGSVIGLDYARQHETNVRGVVFMEAIIPPGFPMADLKPLGGADGLFAKFRTPDVGKELLINQNVFVEQLLAKGALTRQLSEAEVSAYRAPFTDPVTRFPIYVWPNELPIAGEPARNVAAVNAVGDWLKTSKLPKLLQYASPGAIVPPSAAQWMVANYPNIEAQFVGYGAHYLQEDNPEAIGRGISDWYRRTFP